jgi:hypothetical protein
MDQTTKPAGAITHEDLMDMLLKMQRQLDRIDMLVCPHCRLSVLVRQHPEKYPVPDEDPPAAPVVAAEHDHG